MINLKNCKDQAEQIVKTLEALDDNSRAFIMGHLTGYIHQQMLKLSKSASEER